MDLSRRGAGIRVADGIDDAATLVAMKGGRSVAVCLPARNESATVGAIVAAARTLMHWEAPLVDRLVVIDDGSHDGTAAAATDAGAEVWPVAELGAGLEAGRGKGNALWLATRRLDTDLVVFCDADLLSFTTSYVTRLIGPLLSDPGLVLVKGFYDRPQDADGDGGGRTTELLARPLLSLLYPALATMRQPLSGEFAARVDALRSVPFVEGYGVEAGLLIDLLGRYGAEAMAQVDLGVKHHRHRSLVELAAQATEIAAVILARSGALGSVPEAVAVRFAGAEGSTVRVAERPPIG
jgi:glucosyl-3-phosphoglycerate synthase